ncbi:KpsF/GutQ family sugar-phosphate isomerase [Sabulicella rubraurantiaca]|uniref:KpsF/GutQ family sugar-phosphate isomerase n=1 Tax=Sabulicella rubraurantiaca TaxID=2811429 RepID=UPI001A96324F|nr:KpsF/GutQ family sugar-phosphate isomerase [Sabulicella rubraurantiaca]
MSSARAVRDDVPEELGRQVILTEAEGLAALAASLDASFGQALSLLAEVSGRVIVSGMGKSGHVGRKIAATFASTGTPSHFVHPGEASHGDLGMIVRGDAVLALSNSGNTAELSALVAHTRRFAIPLIAITSGAGSALARAADVALLLPPVKEACPMGLAPTTSTTMQLALGDALAVALLHRRGFTAADFGVFHPGGRLGAQLSHVHELMHPASELPLVAPETRMDQALITMTGGRFGCVGVVRDGRLAGVITDGDLRRTLEARSGALLSLEAGEVMSGSPRTVRPDALAAEALRLMNDNKVTALFVVDAAGAPVGILHVHDLLRAGVA